MAYRQLITPKINIKAQRGWCLKYVDDGVNAPKRQPTAQAAYNVQKKADNIHTGSLPVGIWVVGFLRFGTGPYVDLGHVFWIKQDAKGDVQIYDSEVQSGYRGVYHSIAELLAWCGASKPTYLGWSMVVDGAKVAESYTSKPAPKPKPTVSTSYKVKKGDTLSEIIINEKWATSAGLWGPHGDVLRVAHANGISDPNKLTVGQVIKKG